MEQVEKFRETMRGEVLTSWARDAQNELERLREENKNLLADNIDTRAKIMDALRFGDDEKLWPPGVDYVDAACKAIEGCVTLDDVPQTAEEIRAFVGAHMVGLKFGVDGGDPDDGDTYTLTAHDLSSALRDWFGLD